MLENGMFLIERYEILSKVGAGGMSDVYKAKDHVLGRIVAIKVLKTEFSEDVNFVTKFRTEAQSAAGLEHPNIVNIYDVGSENGLHFIVMEYVEGITLKTYVEKKGQLSFKEATSIAIQVARGIEVAHSKEIIHRDIKPQNVIISTEGKVKVTDFGIARAISSNTISAEVMGSVHYASPEQARNGFVDGRSDIYSLGIVMYEMVTGRVPFDGDTTVSVAIQHLQEEMVEPSVYAPELPISYEKIVLKATQKNPDRRYQTIEELLADLRKALANPEEDFVVIAPATVAKTRVIGGEELEAIQNSAASADLEKENAYANTQDDDELDAYDDIDDEEEEEKGIFGPVGDRIVNILLIIFAIAIIGIIIWLGSSVLDLFNKPGDNNPTTPKPPVSSTTQPGSSETETTEEPSSSEDPTDEEEVEMPNILDWNKDQAEQYLKALGLKMSILTNVEDSGKEDGTILSQSEPEGAKVSKGTTIYVTVAGEVTSVIKKEVPNVVGMDELTAKQTLYDHNFRVEIDFEYSDTIEAGLVSSQTPEAEKKVKEGSVVTIYISRGKAPAMVPENLVGEDVKVAGKIFVTNGATFTIDMFDGNNSGSTNDAYFFFGFGEENTAETFKFTSTKSENTISNTIKVRSDTVVFQDFCFGDTLMTREDLLADDTIKEDGILKLMDGIENRNAYFIEVLAYCEYGKEPVTFKSITKGTIAKEKSGEYGWSWDFIFIPEGETKTLGCFDDNVRFSFWSSDGYKELANYLKEKQGEFYEKN